MSGLYEVEFGKARTWRMYSWHSAWYCQSHRLLPKSPLPRAPSSKSYTPVLWKDKEKSTAEISSQVTPCSHMYGCMLKVFFLKYWSNHEAIKHRKNRFNRNPWGPPVFIFLLLQSYPTYPTPTCASKYIIWYLTAPSQHYCWETWAPTWLNVVPNNADVFVSVRPCVFVPEPNHMTQFMHHNSKLVTVFANGYGLGATSTTAHIGAAPVNQRARGGVKKANIEVIDVAF